MLIYRVGISTTVAAYVSDWCITNLTHCWWVSIRTLHALLEEDNVPLAVRYGTDRLLCCLIVHVGIHASEITISLSLLMLSRNFIPSREYVVVFLYNLDSHVCLAFCIRFHLILYLAY